MATSKDNILTAERARELLKYEPETGKLFWRVIRSSRARAGTEAGCVKGSIGNRYRHVQVDGQLYYTHRVIWLIVTGSWPSDHIDHIDGNGFNNRWGNLREASRTENRRNQKRPKNNTSGVIGVGWKKASRKWQAQITVNGSGIHLGYFDTLLAAIEARKAAERQYGFHANHGRAT